MAFNPLSHGTATMIEHFFRYATGGLWPLVRAELQPPTSGVLPSHVLQRASELDLDLQTGSQTGRGRRPPRRNAQKNNTERNTSSDR